MEEEYDFKELASTHLPLKKYLKESGDNFTLDWRDENAIFELTFAILKAKYGI